MGLIFEVRQRIKVDLSSSSRCSMYSAIEILIFKDIPLWRSSSRPLPCSHQGVQLQTVARIVILCPKSQQWIRRLIFEVQPRQILTTLAHLLVRKLAFNLLRNVLNALKLTFAANSNSDLHLPFFTCMCTRVYISDTHARHVVHGSVLLITTVHTLPLPAINK